MAEARSEDPVRISMQREFVTPEGIDLRLQLATAGERAAAFLIDSVIIVLAIIALIIVSIMMLIGTGPDSGQVVVIVALLAFFVLRNGYFIAFELGARGATLGKKIVRLRVVARDGGRLTGDAVIARNAVRELEVGLPFTFLMMGYAQSQAGEFDAYTTLAALVWMGVFVFFPLFNRDRLRVGDLIAGTWVVRVPRRRLHEHVVEHREAPLFAFTDAQLNAYGEFELQKLEEVLRREDELAVIVVARTIRGRIGWTGAEGNDLEFLRAYYAALCRRLERNMLFGKRRADKYAS
jgi:uncharacterized RDD family membrane protein YckC